MRRRQNNINIIDDSLIKLNELDNTAIYTEQYLTEIFNSKENLKKDILMTQLSKILVKDDISLLIYKLEKIDLNLFDTNFFKISDLDLIMANLKKLNTRKILEIFNNFIINHDTELKISLKNKMSKMCGKIKLFNEPILYDYLTGMNVITKNQKCKDKSVDCGLYNDCHDIKNVDLNEDYNFINGIIQKIKCNKFHCTTGTMTKLVKILNAPSTKLVITENQLCEIIRGLKKKYAQNANFIIKLNYHGFVFAMDIMKEKFNINCRDIYEANRKLIEEDNGVLFEYMLKHNKINLSKLDEQFVFKILKGKKINIVNVLIKYKCDLSIPITNILLSRSSSYLTRKYNINQMRDKVAVFEMITLCEKMGYIINDEVFYHILKFLPDEKILEYIEKNNLIIEDVLPFIVKNKSWNLLNKLFVDKKYSKEEYVKNIYKLFSKIKSSISISTYIEIYNYHIAKYKIKPSLSFKRVAFCALELNLIKKLVEKYNFKYTLENVKNYMCGLNRKKNNWNYYNRQNKIHALVLIIDYLSNKFEEIKLIYHDNQFYRKLRKITWRLSDKTILFLLKNKQIKVDKEIFVDVMNSDSPNSLKYMLKNDSNSIDISDRSFLENDISSKNLIILLDHMNKNNIKISQDELLLSFMNGSFDVSSINYLIDNKILEINTKIITLLVLNIVDMEYYYSGDILIKALHIYPKISAKTFEYIENLITNKKNIKYHKTRYRNHRRSDLSLEYLINIVEMKNQLTIISEDALPYKILNMEIDENNLAEAQINFKNLVNYCGFQLGELANDVVSDDEINKETDNNSYYETDENMNKPNDIIIDDITVDDINDYSEEDNVSDSDNSDINYNNLNYLLRGRKTIFKQNNLGRLLKKKINIID